MLDELTARDLVTEALRDSGFTADVENPSADESKIALRKLNEIIGILNLQKLWPVAQTEGEVVLTEAKRSYTIGLDGGEDISQVRPIEVKAIKMLYGDAYIPISQIDDIDWNDKTINTSNTGLPASFRYTPSYPTGFIEFSSTLDRSYTIKLVTNTLTTEYAFDDIMALPAGYYSYLVAELSNKWYLRRKKATNPSLQQQAEIYLSIIKKNNSKSITMKSNRVRTRYNYLSGKNITYG